MRGRSKQARRKKKPENQGKNQIDSRNEQAEVPPTHMAAEGLTATVFVCEDCWEVFSTEEIKALHTCAKAPTAIHQHNVTRESVSAEINPQMCVICDQMQMNKVTLLWQMNSLHKIESDIEPEKTKTPPGSSTSLVEIINIDEANEENKIDHEIKMSLSHKKSLSIRKTWIKIQIQTILNPIHCQGCWSPTPLLYFLILS